MIKLLKILVLIWCFSSLQCTEKEDDKSKEVDSKSTEEIHSMKWWEHAVFYQIYVKSFKDSDGDGYGDLNGIIEKLEHLKNLSIDAFWLSPIFKSTTGDAGYDIYDFYDIDSTFGTMQDFERLLRKAQSMEIKVIMDFVPNHTSDEHKWFIESIKRISPYTDYYVWKDAKYINGKRYPPNNWISLSGKSAWQWNKEREQYYLHQFFDKLPDLNYRNPHVVAEMKKVFMFWLSKGVNGFRLDSINMLVEDEQFLDEPASGNPFAFPDDYKSLNHTYTLDHSENVEIVIEWRKIFDKYSTKKRSKVMLTGAYSNAKHMASYHGTDSKPGAHIPLNCLFLTNDIMAHEWNAYYFQKTILSWYENSPSGSRANWIIGNQDNPRPATRFGPFSIDGLHMLQLLLPGTALVYYGDELGMENTLIRWDETKDPKAIKAGKSRYHLVSRDGCRTPMQWDDTVNAGFTTNMKPWLPVNPGYFKVNVKNELSNKSLTHLKIFRDLVNLRKNIVFQRGDMDIYVLSDWVIALTRSHPDRDETFVVVVNLGNEFAISNLIEHRPSLPKTMSVMVPSVNSNYARGDIICTDRFSLRPKAAIVLFTSA